MWFISEFVEFFTSTDYQCTVAKAAIEHEEEEQQQLMEESKAQED